MEVDTVDNLVGTRVDMVDNLVGIRVDTEEQLRTVLLNSRKLHDMSDREDMEG